MKVEDVKVVKGPPVTADVEEVQALEAKLWLKFPEGYREYVSRLGEGFLADFIRIHPPWQVEKELDVWRRLRSQYWFWDADSQLLPKARGVECVSMGDTINGDQLVFHPCRPDRLFVLPRHHPEVFEAGSDLFSAVDWMLRSGRLIADAPRKLRFEAFDSRLEDPDEDEDDEESGSSFGSPDGRDVSANASMEDLIGAVRVWADRRRVHRRAERFIAGWAQNGMILSNRSRAGT